MTAGNDLADKVNQRWSARLSEYLSANGWYDGPEINVTNVAVGACDVTCWYPRVATTLDRADVVILDLSVNDSVFNDIGVLPKLYTGLIELLYALPKRPALLFVTAFRTSNRDPADMHKHCPAAADELTVDRRLGLQQGSCCGGYYWCKQWYDMHNPPLTVLQHQGIPYISYRDLVWPDYRNPPENLPSYWNGLSHPDLHAHQLMAKAVAYMFMRQLETATEKAGILAHLGAPICADSTHPPLGSYGRPFVGNLSHPLTQMLATDSPSSKELFTFSGPVPTAWSFYNDTGSKYGWILEPDVSGLAEACGAANFKTAMDSGSGPSSVAICESAVASTTLTIPVTLSSNPVVVISYLKSYKPYMGSVVVWVDDDRLTNVTLDGRWDNDFQLTQTAALSGTSQDAGESYALWLPTMWLPTLQPGEHTISIALDTSRLLPKSGPKYMWKLLGISSY